MNFVRGPSVYDAIHFVIVHNLINNGIQLYPSVQIDFITLKNIR